MMRATKKRLIILVAIAAAILITGIAFMKFYSASKQVKSPGSSQDTTKSQTNQNNVNNINYDAPTDEEKNATQDTNPKSSSQPSDQPRATDTLPVEITAAVQDESKLQLRVLISKLIATGTCTLRLSQSGQQDIVITTGVQALSSSSTCKGFDIDTSGLSRGTWVVNISVTADDLTGNATKEVTIK